MDDTTLSRTNTALAVAKFTEALLTPESFRNASSKREAQPAQCIPEIRNSIFTSETNASRILRG
jgi:hypothetical protein